MSQPASKFNSWPSRDVGGVERRVRTYLADQARNGGVFIKSHRVAEDLELSTRRAAQAIHVLRRDSTVLEVTEWSGSSANAATWHVELVDGPTPFGRDCECGRLLPEDAADCPHCGRRVER